MLEPYSLNDYYGGWYCSHPNDMDNLDNGFAVSNAVKYTSPTIAGFTGEVLYSFGENLEILAYLYWPALIVIGRALAFRDSSPDDDPAIAEDTADDVPDALNAPPGETARASSL